MKRVQSRRARARLHLVDRAISWASRTNGPDGISQAALRRSLSARERRSKCYVSHVVQLGRALANLPPLELALYRDPRVTYRVVSQVVGRNRSPVEIRALLRAAITTPPSVRPRRPRRVPAPTDRPPSHGSAQAAWSWNSRRALAHPLLEVRGLATHLDQLLQEATIGLEAAIARRHNPVALAGQSLGMLVRSIDSYRRAQTQEQRQEIRPVGSEVDALKELAALRSALRAAPSAGQLSDTPAVLTDKFTTQPIP